MPLADWIRDHPPPATIAIDQRDDDGPFRAAAGPILIRRAGVPRVTLPPRDLRPPRAQPRPPPRGGFRAWLASIDPFSGDTRVPTGQDHRELHLDPPNLRVDGDAYPCALPLGDLVDFDHRGDELRAMRSGERTGYWPTVWRGPADERRWIERLLRAAAIAARAREWIATSSPSWP